MRGNVGCIKSRNMGLLIFYAEISRFPADFSTIKPGKFSINPSPINQRFLVVDGPEQTL
jgi:hypothetical protein